MKTLHFYLTRQILATLLMTVAVFTFVLILGNVLKEIMTLLVSGADLRIVAKAIGLLIPFVLVFALPMGMLTATLLVFGRFSADQELTAARASGVSLLALVTPILILSVFLTGVSAWINLDIAPRCRVAYKQLIDDLKVEMLGSPTSLLRENQYVQDIAGGYTVYVEKITGETLHEVYIHEANAEENYQRWFKAARGTLEYDSSSSVMTLTLAQPFGAMIRGDNVQPIPAQQGELIVPLELKPSKTRIREPDLSEMTFVQLRAKLQELEALYTKTEPVRHGSSAHLRRELDQLQSMRKDAAMPARVHLHRMVSFSFACIGFTLIGIPLGIRAHRRETSVGVAIALVLVLAYYSFIILGHSLKTRADLAPHLIVWLPNFVFQAVGAVLLWRANKGI